MRLTAAGDSVILGWATLNLLVDELTYQRATAEMWEARCAARDSVLDAEDCGGTSWFSWRSVGIGLALGLALR